MISGVINRRDIVESPSTMCQQSYTAHDYLTYQALTGSFNSVYIHLGGGSVLVGNWSQAKNSNDLDDENVEQSRLNDGRRPITRYVTVAFQKRVRA